VIVRVFVWNLFESRTTMDELRESLPDLESPSTWIWNEASERFGIVVFREDLPEAVEWARDLIGDEPSVYEEFETLD